MAQRWYDACMTPSPRPRTLHLDDEVWERLGGYALRHRQSRSAAASIILTHACDDDELRNERRVANG